MRLTLAILTLLLFAPAAAHAEWTGQTLSTRAHLRRRPAVIVSGDGGALASWRFQEGLGNRSRAGSEGATRAPGAAGFGARVAIVPRDAHQPAARRPSPGSSPTARAARCWR